MITVPEYFDYPLEQGLRPSFVSRSACSKRLYFDYPLEQGLRLKMKDASQKQYRVF